MLPSAVATASAPAISSLSWLNLTPHTITVYASPWSSPSTTQHSLPSGRYPLLGPDFRRLDRASFLAHRYAVKGANVAQTPWFQDALKLRSGDDYVAGDIERQPLLGNAPVATYCASVREGGDADPTRTLSPSG